MNATSADSVGRLVTIVDDFLDAADLASLQEAVRRLEVYPPPPAEYPGLVWRPGDVPPLLSREIHHSTDPQSSQAFRPLARQLAAARIEGRQLMDFSIRLQVGRRGTSLGAHHDGNDPDSGGFAFYLSDQWDPHWGGLLLAFDPATFVPQPGQYSLLDAAEQHRRLNDTGVNYALTPRRNRLVLLRHPVRHMVTERSPAAGDHLRLACTGYFRWQPAIAAQGVVPHRP